MKAILQACLSMKIKSNRTKIYYRRIPNDPELVKLMDSAVLEAAKNSFKVSEWLGREYGVKYKDYVEGTAVAKISSKDVQSIQPVEQKAVKGQESTFTGQFAKQVEEDRTRKQIGLLLDDVERLTKELAYWKDRFEKAVQASEGQLVSYWRDRANKAEKAFQSNAGVDQT